MVRYRMTNVEDDLPWRFNQFVDGELRVMEISL